MACYLMSLSHVNYSRFRTAVRERWSCFQLPSDPCLLSRTLALGASHSADETRLSFTEFAFSPEHRQCVCFVSLRSSECNREGDNKTLPCVWMSMPFPSPHVGRTLPSLPQSERLSLTQQPQGRRSEGPEGVRTQCEPTFLSSLPPGLLGEAPALRHDRLLAPPTDTEQNWSPSQVKEGSEKFKEAVHLRAGLGLSIRDPADCRAGDIRVAPRGPPPCDVTEEAPCSRFRDSCLGGGHRRRWGVGSGQLMQWECSSKELRAPHFCLRIITK